MEEWKKNHQLGIVFTRIIYILAISKNCTGKQSRFQWFIYDNATIHMDKKVRGTISERDRKDYQVYT